MGATSNVPCFERLRAAALGASAVVVFAVALRPSAGVALGGDYEAAVTRISVKLTGRLSSQNNRSGDRFAFDTTSSVEVDGLFLAAGTHGHGFVLDARAAAGSRPGVLTLSARSLDLADGTAIAVGLDGGELVPLASDGGVLVPSDGARVERGRLQLENVVFDKGTAFVVVAPPRSPGVQAAAGT